jgi:hypothetical protein
MEVLNLVDIFKNYIENIVSEEDKILFEDIFLGKRFSSNNTVIYTKEEYYDYVKNILRTQGQGFAYGEFGLYERKPMTLQQDYISRAPTQTTRHQKSLIYPYEPSPIYMKNLKDFNSFIFNPVYPFIFLEKIYTSFNFQKVFAEISRGAADELLERWRDYFLPFVKDYCSYYQYISDSNKFLVYSGKDTILVSSVLLSATKEKEYHTQINSTKFKYIYNYE